MSTKPSPCKFCARLAPVKCKWHGGPSRSTSAAGRRARKGIEPPPATKSSPKPATRPTVARNGSLDARVQSMLDDAKARVTALRAELADTEKRVALLTELVG